MFEHSHTHFESLKFDMRVSTRVYMADDESEEIDGSPNQTPLKDYWAGLQSNISAAGNRVAASSKKAAKAAFVILLNK